MNQIFMYFILREASEPGVKLVDCKSALTPPVVYTADSSKAVLLVMLITSYVPCNIWL